MTAPDPPISDPLAPRPPPLAPAAFRWQSFFQRSTEPIFLLDRRRRILFVNEAWVNLTGLPAAEARGLVCTRRATDGSATRDVLSRVLCPTPEAMRGQYARVRRLVTGLGPERRCWDVEFFPLGDGKQLLCILSKITPAAAGEPARGTPLPEKLVALRQKVAQRYRLDELASALPAMHRVADQVRLAAQTQAAVLLVGEPGTGKEWVARTIHSQGPQADRSFVRLDTAALPAVALTSLLFGEGGLLRRPEVGSLYLRDPSRLPRDLQGRLLDLLREPDAKGPRIMAGCVTDPVEEVRSGRLLEEFRCALSTLVLELPPLRDRQADLGGLVEKSLRRATADLERPVTGLAPDAWELVRAYSWPGNLRELYAVLTQACQHTKGALLTSNDLPAYLRLSVQMARPPETGSERPLPLDQLLEEAERRLIRLALKRAKGNKSRAADLLAIWRPRLLRRMELLGIEDVTLP